MGVALATPFLTDGTIDFKALEKLIDGIITGGADFICVLGTTAETPTLTADEKAAVMRTAVAVTAGRVPLLLGAGGNNTRQVCEELQHTDLTGFQGVLIVCPYYNKPSQEGLYQHFMAVGKASPLPVVLYNVPGRTGVNMEAATTLRIARDCENIVAVKEASGKIGQIEDIIKDAPEGFEVLSGDDAITYELLTLGAVGVISVVGNAYPAEFSEMVHLTMQGINAEALKLHRRFGDLYKLMSVDGNPAGIKCLLSVQGKAENTLHLPVVSVRTETEEKIRKAVAAF